MNFFKRALPHLTIALALALLVLAILNEFNPRVGFLQGKGALLIIALTCLCAAACGVVLAVRQAKK